MGAAISASRAAAALCGGGRWGEGVQRGGRWCSQEAWIAQGMGWVGERERRGSLYSGARLVGLARQGAAVSNRTGTGLTHLHCGDGLHEALLTAGPQPRGILPQPKVALWRRRRLRTAMMVMVAFQKKREDSLLTSLSRAKSSSLLGSSHRR